MLDRRDLNVIFDIIKPNSKVLDLGCGDGSLLKELIERKDISGLGIEISIEKIKACMKKGISVIQEDLNEGLKEFQENSFDYVVLSQTLEYIANPVYLILEMLRVGKKCIISFENLAYWKNRISFLFRGTIKRERVKNIDPFYGKKVQILTVIKFSNFCKYYHINISSHFYLAKNKLKIAQIFPNTFSQIAIFILKGDD
ncbi:MAG: methionine biosynthesis protein MetW [Candidatus Thorarchaeota archaeon]